jgi:hypothetical protein
MIADELFKYTINNINPLDYNPTDLDNILIQIIKHYKDFKPYNITKEINDIMTLQVNLLGSNNIIIDRLKIFNKNYMYSEQYIIDECIEILNTVEPYKNKFKYKSKNLQIIANIKQKKTCHIKNIKKVLTIINQYYMKVIANDLSNIIWCLGKLTSMKYKYTSKYNKYTSKYTSKNNIYTRKNIIEICNIITYIINSNEKIIVNKIIFSDYNMDKIIWGLDIVNHLYQNNLNMYLTY